MTTENLFVDDGCDLHLKMYTFDASTQGQIQYNLISR